MFGTNTISLLGDRSTNTSLLDLKSTTFCTTTSLTLSLSQNCYQIQSKILLTMIRVKQRFSVIYQKTEKNCIQSGICKFFYESNQMSRL